LEYIAVHGGIPLLVGFTNFDWVGNCNAQNSTIGYVFTFDCRPIIWVCKKQQDIFLSLVKEHY